MHNRKSLSSIPKEIATPIVDLTLTHVRFDNTIIHLQPTSHIIAAIPRVKKMPTRITNTNTKLQHAGIVGTRYPKRI
ncbi:MAG: hypothetical protein JO327_09060 [Nitrososphaeraceae archaeon]|nr:hypothetical protein [Nitrososphaeraceae archaeon]MBV9668264.1 hypothetical protein [Nitrososphaeraceae archaeon]